MTAKNHASRKATKATISNNSHSRMVRLGLDFPPPSIGWLWVLMLALTSKWNDLSIFPFGKIGKRLPSAR
jgi:hypothetical protein